MHYYLPFQLLNLFYTDAKLVKMKELTIFMKKCHFFLRHRNTCYFLFPIIFVMSLQDTKT